MASLPEKSGSLSHKDEGNASSLVMFEEYDEAGTLMATYAASSQKTDTTDGRLDRIAARNNEKTPWQRLLDVFLPAGYPNSVTDDYTAYQIYDSLQAFSSSIAGLIASRAVLEGVGVGNAKASPTAALLLSTLQESMGRIATILFAHRLGTALEPECKMYRLLADIFNDAAMILDCLSPAFPIAARVILLSSSSVLRALCGVAAGSAKASLSAHFARWGNLGELNAKDSSQETVISLMGMLVGSIVVSWVTTPAATWVTLLVLLAVHLATNHAAVRAVKMATFNRQRCNILFSTLIETGEVLTPAQVSARERIFETDGVLRWSQDDAVVGQCSLGVSLQQLAAQFAEPGHATGSSSGGGGGGGGRSVRSVRYRNERWLRMLSLFQGHGYLLWVDAATRKATIVMMQGASATEQLQAWVHALWACRRLAGHVDAYEAVAQAKSHTEALFVRHRRAIADAGWHLEAGVALETRSGVRLRRGKVS